jgi:CRISPR system Cascade subunit CasE
MLNLRNKAARRDIANPYEMHSTLSRAFSPPDQKCPPGAFLWRLEPSDALEKYAVVYIQSAFSPDWSRIGDSEWFYQQPSELPMNLSDRWKEIKKEKLYRFRLRGNPCKTMQGKRIGLYQQEDQIKWILRKGELHGFQLIEDSKHGHYFVQTSNDHTSVGFQRKNGHQINIFSVLFDGILKVTDVEKFDHALRFGIGHGKAMGLGLLSVRAVYENSI